jgi:Protein of unknown function (DUF4064)
LKRTPEFVLGLIGGILGTIVCFGLFILLKDNTDEVLTQKIDAVITFGIIQVAALVFSCLVNNINHKLYGFLMLSFGLLSLYGTFTHITVLMVSAVLYLISGGLAFRKLKPSTTNISG